jgi:putative FmdB family regulatory protein
MPLYEYQCESCAHRFELIRKFSDPPLATCPSCGGPVKKLLSSPAFQFKGTGWYVTDYAKKTASSDGASGDSKSGDSKSDNKSGEKSGDSKSSSGAKDSSSDSTTSKPTAPSRESKDSTSTASKKE